MNLTIRELLERSPLDTVRSDALLGAGYLERILSNPAHVILWNGLRQAAIEAGGLELEPGTRLEAAKEAHILRDGIAVPLSDGRLEEADLIQLLLCPAQLEAIAAAAEAALLAGHPPGWLVPELAPEPVLAPVVLLGELRLEQKAAAETPPRRGMLIPRGAAASAPSGSDADALPRIEVRKVSGGLEVALHDVPASWSRPLFADRDDLGLATLHLIDSDTKAPIFESFVVVFRSAERTIGKYGIEWERWAGDFPGLLGATQLRAEVTPLTPGKLDEALEGDPGDARIQLHRAWVIGRVRDDDTEVAVRRLLERLPPAEEGP